MFVLRNGKVTVFSSKIFACGGLLAGSPSGWPASAKCWGAPWPTSMGKQDLKGEKKKIIGSN